ncbi:hypothetical protein CLOP_g14449, partial [Closterium sp. NIES-67]
LDECVQHVQHLQRVFDILRRERFYVKLSKSEFALEKVQFLGHMVSAQGVHVDPENIEAVHTWKTPENVKELQQFLGFANHYNRFVPHTHRRDSTTIRSLHHLRLRPQVHQQVLEGTDVSARDKTRHVIRLPSADRWTDRAPKPNCRATPPRSMQRRNLLMGLPSTRPGVCLQQRHSCHYGTDAVLPLLRTPPAHATKTDSISHTTWKIHNAFHVQLLKPYRDPNTVFTGRQPPPPPPVLVHDKPEYEVESVLAHNRCRNGTMELLILWKGYAPSEDDWVPESEMGNARCPLHDYL